MYRFIATFQDRVDAWKSPLTILCRILEEPGRPPRPINRVESPGSIWRESGCMIPITRIAQRQVRAMPSVCTERSRLSAIYRESGSQHAMSP